MKSVIISFLLFGLSLGLTAQYQNIMISNSASPNEPSICIDPNNTDRLVAGANVDKYFVSKDGGYSWESGILKSPGYVVWGDPVIIIDTAGHFYFLHLSYVPGGPWIDRIYCQKYDFDNDIWSDGSYMGKNGAKAQDKEWAVVDGNTNTIHVTWTQFDKYDTIAPDYYTNILYSKSIDNGLTWSQAKQINEVSGNCIDSSLAVEGAVPTVGPNGEIYVSWSGPAGLVFDKSIDQGETWLENDILVNEQPGGWYMDIPGIERANGMPVTCCDLSDSPYKGTIYVNWADKRNGPEDSDIFISKSIDGGQTWSDAKRVNDDPPGKNQFFSWMTIDQVTGYIYIVFYDRRNYNDWNTDVYVAKSMDGGETFTNMRVSDNPFYPNYPWFFGDYNNITAHNNIVRPIWTRCDQKSMSIWTAIMDFQVGTQDPQFVEPAILDQNYPNPFSETTYLSYKLWNSDIISVYVIDIFGRKVVSLMDNEHTEPGKYTLELNAEDYMMKTGVYHIVLETSSYIRKQKMILID